MSQPSALRRFFAPLVAVGKAYNNVAQRHPMSTGVVTTGVHSGTRGAGEHACSGLSPGARRTLHGLLHGLLSAHGRLKRMLPICTLTAPTAAHGHWQPPHLFHCHPMLPFTLASAVVKTSVADMFAQKASAFQPPTSPRSCSACS